MMVDNDKEGLTGSGMDECGIILSHDSHLLLSLDLVRCLTTVELNK